MSPLDSTLFPPLQRLLDESGAGILPFDSQGRLTLSIGDRLSVDFCVAATARLVVQARIGALHAEPRGELFLDRVFQQILAVALQRAEIVTFDLDKQQLWLQRWLSKNLTDSAFTDELDTFIDALSAWRDWFNQNYASHHP